jgi:hypothetical protein
MTQVVQVVLDLLTPMQGFLRDLAVFMLFVELGKLVHAEPVVALDLVFVLVIRHQHAIHCQETHLFWYNLVF